VAVLELPSAVLFACSHNAIRSPMAAGLMRYLYGGKLFVASVGVRAASEPDPFMVAVMDELGIDMSRHKPQSFADLDDQSFDLVVSLSPEAHHKALELTRTMAIEAEYWPTADPSAGMGSREQILDGYREVRDGLLARLRGRFASGGARGV
jgi:protein-tyrosine-phosphatase